MNYLDIHTHTGYHNPETRVILNVFAAETEKLQMPGFFSVGLHPWHVEEHTWQEGIEAVQQASQHPQVLAIGEAGLDKTIAAPYAVQLEAFKAQLHIAEFVHKPMIIHCVRSYSEMLAIRKKADQSLPWIFHWFNADRQMAREFIRKNCYLSFGHMLFNPQSKAYGAFQDVPAERIFFETDDAGYTIEQVYEKAASLRNTDIAGLKTRIMDNFGLCFQRLPAAWNIG